jgi:uncharacterized protein (TIGR02646 family)
MQKVKKNYVQRPLSLDLHRAPYSNAVQSVINHGGWFATASKLYRADSVKELLNSIYNKKCGFCDQQPIGSPAQVEHFRPKDGIEGTTHPGYYWLAYEWSNLLLACGNCNSRKGNNFPISNPANRVAAATLLANGRVDEKTNFILNNPLKPESYILLNPEIDNPEEHITFLPNGIIQDLTDRGRESIFHYNLNRDELSINGRKRILDSINKKLSKRLDRYISGAISAKIVHDQLTDVIEEDIIHPISNNLSHCSFYKFILQNYRLFFIDPIGNPKAAILLNYSFLKVIKHL